MRSQSGENRGERILCGGVTGFASSVFGGGGGMIAVPMLKRVGLREKQAHATAILLILPVAALSFLVYAWKGIYDFSLFIPTAIGVTLGGLLGAKLLRRLSGKAVKIVFALLQAAAGIFLLFF